MLDHLEERWRDDEGTFAGVLAEADAPLAASCSQLWTACYDEVAAMEEAALEMPPEMREVHSRLVDVQRRLQEILEREHDSQEVAAVVAELDAVDALRRERGGVFLGDVEAPPPGQAVCSELLSHGYELAMQAASTAHDEPAELRAAAAALRAARNDLRKLLGQRHHTAADLDHYRFILGAIAATEGEYGAEWEGSATEGLLKECIDMVEQLEESVEAMPLPVEADYMELKRLKKSLSAAHSSAGRPAEEDLARWEAALSGVDDRRAAAGGVFGGSGEEGGVKAPPGQVVCSTLLHECYTLLHELQER